MEGRVYVVCFIRVSEYLNSTWCLLLHFKHRPRSSQAPLFAAFRAKRRSMHKFVHCLGTRWAPLGNELPQ